METAPTSESVLSQSLSASCARWTTADNEHGALIARIALDHLFGALWSLDLVGISWHHNIVTDHFDLQFKFVNSIFFPAATQWKSCLMTMDVSDAYMKENHYSAEASTHIAGCLSPLVRKMFNSAVTGQSQAKITTRQVGHKSQRTSATTAMQH